MLLLVRHGRTAANASGLLIGRLDPPLDAEGVRQAEAVGRAVAVEAANCNRVIASPLDRTRKTAEKIAAGLGVEVELDDRWIELDYGTLDGLRLGDVPAEVWSAWRADPAHVPGGGESLLALGRRVQQAAEALLPSIEGGDVVVVSHVSPIKAAVAWALGVGDEVSWRMFLSPASITRIACRGGAPTLVSFNDTSALS
ncbi:MAG: histidine phosphatase family protein [Actinobacteria bacterium]|nr:histidine phosphatase family protein [Actinomycetota bacterium]